MRGVLGNGELAEIHVRSDETNAPADGRRAAMMLGTLQAALDIAHDRIRDNERIIAELNARLAEQTERRDDAEFRLLMLQASAPARIDATLPDRDVSPLA